jgi:hypothetical protein
MGYGPASTYIVQYGPGHRTVLLGGLLMCAYYARRRICPKWYHGEYGSKSSIFAVGVVVPTHCHFLITGTWH